MATVRTIGNRLAPKRFLLFFALLVVALGVGAPLLPWQEAFMAAFDTAALGFLLSCISLFNDTPEAMRRAARENDANRPVLLIVTAILSLVILAAVAGELARGEKLGAVEIALVLATLLLAWIFANAVYALHYAHLFYTGADGGKDSAGLDFPGERKEPDYADFVYFAFTLGVAVQTSDVCITSPHIRRIVTLHCVAAFIFNLGIVAMAINVVANNR
jgi:uncharacterized membrane protein